MCGARRASYVAASLSEPGTTTATCAARSRSPNTSATWPRPRGSKARICRCGEANEAKRGHPVASTANRLASYRRASGAPSRLPTTSGWRRTSSRRPASSSPAKNRATSYADAVAGSGSGRPDALSARQAAVPGGGPVTACGLSPEAHPALPPATATASAAVTSVLPNRRIRLLLSS